MNTTKVDKLLGENIKKTNKLWYHHHSIANWSWFVMAKKNYCDFLRKKGYEVSTSGNYITATSNNETNTFFFTAHSAWNTNYLLPKVLKNRVQYFVFYDEAKSEVYTLAYNKVREYCKTIEHSIYFKDKNDQKLLVPDSWAKSQTLNTDVL